MNIWKLIKSRENYNKTFNKKIIIKKRQEENQVLPNIAYRVKKRQKIRIGSKTNNRGINIIHKNIASYGDE